MRGRELVKFGTGKTTVYNGKNLKNVRNIYVINTQKQKTVTDVILLQYEHDQCIIEENK